MMTLKKTALALCLGATIALTGCSSFSLTGGSEDQVEQTYQQFLDEKPSFDIVTVHPTIDKVYKSVAKLCELQYQDLESLDKVTTEHMDGYKIFSAVEALRAEEDGKDKADAYVAKLTDTEKTAYEAYLTEAGKETARIQARLEEALKLLEAVTGFAKGDVLKNASMMEKAAMGIPMKRASEQVNYAVKSAQWAQVFNATLTNAKNDLGR